MAVDFDPFAGPALERSVASTESQRELWVASQIGDEASCAYNESVTLELRGELDRGALRGALRDLLEAHEALRGAFSEDGTIFVITEGVLDLVELDWSERASERQEWEWRALVDREVEVPFDLRNGPLVRFRLVKRDPRWHQLVVTAHHAVCDGWSHGVIAEDLGRAYSARVAGSNSELGQRPRFSEYARSEWDAAGSAEHADSLAFWTRCFGGEVPVLDLPTDRARGAQRTFDSAREDRRLDEAFVRRVKEFAARNQASFFSACFTAFKVLLARLSGQDDVAVGVPAAGQGIAGADLLVGHCVRTLPMRTRIDLSEGFGPALRRVQATVLDSYEHHHVTLGALLKHLSLARDPARLPLVDHLFNVEQADRTELAFFGLDVHWYSNARRFEHFDLSINIVEDAGGVTVELQYSTGLYETETVRRWMEAFESILAQGMDQPARPLASLSLLAELDAERLASWNETAVDWPGPATVMALLARQRDRCGDRPALLCGGEALGYRELHQRAHQVARGLANRGIGRGDLVALCLPRSSDLVVCLLGILEVGAAYLPIDPELPAQRVSTMLEDSRARLLLSSSELGDRLPFHGERLYMDRERAALQELPATPLEVGVGPGDLAYVIYTSGSTGRPKGVQVPHSCVANFLCSMAREPGMGPDDAILAVTSLGFDISVLELLLPLCVGARVVLATREESGDAAALSALLERHAVTVMQGTPATFRMLLAGGWEGKGDLRLLCGGEALSLDLARQLGARCAQLWNLYGPTETTVWSTIQRVPARPEKIRIGRPIANTTCYVLDEGMNPVPPGVAGELYIGGSGVTRGYLRQPDLSRERFLPDPFGTAGAEANSRLYRTGDIARYDSDGALECLGRRDFQVKIRGHRIELGEIEAALEAQPGVRESVAVARDEGGAECRLVAYYVAERGAELSVNALRAHLEERLPGYMVPAAFVALDAFPLTPSGKVDRRTLPAPSQLRPALEESFVAPATETEKAIAGLCRSLLGVMEVGVHDDFFALGADSILLVQLAAQIHGELGSEIRIAKLFESPTVGALAAHVEALRLVSRDPDVKPAASSGEREEVRI